MANVYLTFSGDRYHDQTCRTFEAAPRFGADVVHVVDDCWLRDCRPGHWERTAHFRERKDCRGVDWFCFKPFVIWDFYRRLAPGDVLLYADGDTYPVAPLTPLYDECRRIGGAMLFKVQGCPQGVWTRRDVFLVMGTDRPEYHNATQAVARFMLFEKGGAFPVDEFLGEWLTYTMNPLVNTFDPSVIAPAMGLPELPGFQANRCEQSVLGMLAVAYGVPKLYREACQFGEGSPGTVRPMEDRDLMPGPVFHQEGRHSYDPNRDGEGSSFRNMWS